MARLIDTETEQFYLFRFGRKDYFEVMVEVEGTKPVSLSVRRQGECMWKPLGKLPAPAKTFFNMGQWRNWLKERVAEKYGLSSMRKARR